MPDPKQEQSFLFGQNLDLIGRVFWQSAKLGLIAI